MPMNACWCIFVVYFFSFTFLRIHRNRACVYVRVNVSVCVCVYGRSGMVDRLHYAHFVLAQIFKIGSEHGCTTLEKTKNKLEKDPEWEWKKNDQRKRTENTEHRVYYTIQETSALRTKSKSHATRNIPISNMFIAYECFICVVFYSTTFCFSFSFHSAQSGSFVRLCSSHYLHEHSLCSMCLCVCEIIVLRNAESTKEKEKTNSKTITRQR